MIIAAPTTQMLRAEAARNTKYLQEILAELSLVLHAEKSRNLILRPKLLPKGIFRRTDIQSCPSTKKRIEAQLQAIAATRQKRRSSLQTGIFPKLE